MRFLAICLVLFMGGVASAEQLSCEMGDTVSLNASYSTEFVESIVDEAGCLIREDDAVIEIRQGGHRPKRPSKPRPPNYSGGSSWGHYGGGGGCNMNGCWNAGGGCNMNGCWNAGGGCNMNGCWNAGGGCNMNGCW